MSVHPTYQPKTAAGRWLEERLPIMGFVRSHLMDYPDPEEPELLVDLRRHPDHDAGGADHHRHHLVMHYTPHADMAFDSVEHIMRDVNYGWLLRYIHSNGASMFFIAVYIHIFRGMYYGSYKAPREVLWMIGVLIYLVMMATALHGLCPALGADELLGSKGHHQPVLAPFPSSASRWRPGCGAASPSTIRRCSRFFSLHYLLPFVLAGLVGLHIWALHVPGNGNPTGVAVKSQQDIVPFHPYYTLKDGFAMVLFFLFFSLLYFLSLRTISATPINYQPANPLSTPAHIVPEWYYLPFYAILALRIPAQAVAACSPCSARS